MANGNLITDFNMGKFLGAVKDAAKEEKKERTKSQFWVNVGINIDGVHYALPLGIALDELKARPIPGPKTQNQEFRNLRKGEAELWAGMEKLMAKLEPGQEFDLTKNLNFSAVLRRIDAKETETVEETSDSPIRAMFASL